MNENKPNGQAVHLQEILNLVKSVGTTSYRSAEAAFTTFFHSGKTENPSLFADILDEIHALNEKIIDMTWLNEHLRILHDFGRTCSQTLNEKVLMEKAFELVSQVMPTDSFFIALWDEGSHVIQMSFMVENGEILPPVDIPFEDGSFTAKVIKSKETIHGKTAKELDEFNYIIGADEPDTCIFVPLLVDDQVKGVISAQSNREFAFRKEHEDLLQIIGNQVISSIVTARLYTANYEMSLTDEMTGLGNYRAFHSDLEKLVQAGKSSVSLLMIDSDGLKSINDRFGHHAGDLYLKTIADGMKSLCGRYVKAYRYAGDEFMLILDGAGLDELDSYFIKLRQYLDTKPLYFQNIKLHASFSGGAAVYPLHADSSEALKRTADLALYKAKRMGKNQYYIFSQL
ncbi:sensor domain-containing diguanylate cyclase [Peribacillus kribbensis]|uniref:sensor domain-containing diguanylate cyclase n=1 Tax=Peribacillus kribbensis TaxID=356658 RepID=UPI0004139F8A|nr:GGDEF domain-containing protein [Peribacillus kribbensis]